MSSRRPQSPRRRNPLRRLAAAFALLAAGIVGYGFVAFAGATGEPRFERAVDTRARDVSATFAGFGPVGHLDDAAIADAFADVAGRLRGTRIVIVPGYLTDGLQLTNRVGMTDYLASQIAGLAAAGFAIELAPVDTEAPAVTNAKVLADLLAADDRPVCFVSHSKGGLDTLAFLVAADAATRARVVCWLAFQAPFYGSPIADLASGSKPLRALADPFAEWLGGSGQSLTDLTVAVREPWMADHDGTIRALVATMPILCVATRIDTPTVDLPSLYMRPAYDWMRARGVANDGLVPVASSVLPGARYLVLDGLDHTDTVADNPTLDTPEKRLLFLQALLALTLASES